MLTPYQSYNGIYLSSEGQNQLRGSTHLTFYV